MTNPDYRFGCLFKIVLWNLDKYMQKTETSPYLSLHMKTKNRYTTKTFS